MRTSRWEGRWWCLEALVTDEKFQRKGLGSRLVRWGLERVEEDVRGRNGLLEDRGGKEGDGEKCEGCYLVASQQGERTYINAGFVKVGSMKIEMGGKGEGGGEKYEHLWFVKRFV